MNSKNRKRLYLCGATIGLSWVLSGAAEATLYDVKVKLINDVTVEALQFEIDYSAAGGNFSGSGDTVDCTVNSNINATGAFYDDDSGDELRTSLMKLSPGIDGIVRIITCTFDASSKPATTDFVVTVTDWYPTTVSPDPDVSVYKVEAQ